METVILQHIDFTEGSLGPTGVSLTYLNCVPLQRYREYCNINSVKVKLRFNGHCRVKFKHLFINKSVREEEINVDDYSEFILYDGDLVIIEPIQPSSNLKGTVEADVSNKRAIALEHVVCTYHRENVIYKKASLFSSAYIQNYHMTIVDNGSTLDSMNSPLIEVIKMPNLGGSSGFTKGIIAGLNRGSTNILLNDDDALMYPESVFRITQFLSLISDIYVDSIISGIYLEVNNPNIIRETGGFFDRGLLTLCNEGLDVRIEEDLISILANETANYSAWTCCCIPSTIIQRTRFPLPMFIRFDDTEYGLRLKKRVISIPGVSTWHPVSKSYPLSYCYYDIRNNLITLSCLNELDCVSINNTFNRIMCEIVAYRYDCAEEMLKGVKDFIKGPDFVFNCCKEGMRSINISYQGNSNDLRRQLKYKRETTVLSKTIRKKTMNGLFLPSVGDIELNRCETETKYYYRVGKVLYSFDNGMGIIKARSLIQSIVMTIKSLVVKRILIKQMKKLDKLYEEAIVKYSSQEHWQQLWNEKL